MYVYAFETHIYNMYIFKSETIYIYIIVLQQFVFRSMFNILNIFSIFNIWISLDCKFSM